MKPEPSEKFNLGYVFYPGDRPHHLGYSRLDIILAAEPTGRHYDPEKVQLPAVTCQNDIEQLEVDHPWRGSKDHRVSVGWVRMIDRRNKIVDAYTYGGSLQIDSTPERTICVHRSPAVILELTPLNPLAALLLQETEILLAERRAAWLHDLNRFTERLANIDPVALYAACLNAVHEKYRHIPATEEDTTRRFVHFLGEEIHDVHDRHNLPNRSLSDIL